MDSTTIIAGASWVVMTAAGIGCMVAMKFTNEKIDFILRRVAAACFAGAGTVGATGWIGTATDTLMEGFVSITDHMSKGVLGAPVSWILVAGVGLAWVGAFLPNKLFALKFPDLLSYSGLVLPPMLASVPGSLGDGLDQIVTWCGTGMVTMVGGLI